MGFLPAISILVPVIAAPVVLSIRKRSLRRAFILCALAINAIVAFGLILLPDTALTVFTFSDRLSVYFAVDNAARLFCGLSAMILLLTGIFSGEYMKHGADARFYFFYLIAAGALNGVGLSGNMLTLYLFFELLTLCTMPLVLHDMTKEAVGAACKYLFYSIAGAALGLAGLIFAHTYGTTLSFVTGGVLDMTRIAGQEGVVLITSFCAIVGFSAKAGMFPLHSWLPAAHPVAPAPASAILSGIITKAGAFAVFRFVYQIIGADFLRGTWVQHTWATLAMVTILLGSVMAFKSDVFKRRLAFSSVSQVSYILLSLSLLSFAGVYGAAIHMVFHSVAKDAMFLIAGAISNKTGKTRISGLRGIGREMPFTMCAFTLAALAVIGIPPSIGFLGKWSIAGAALSSGEGIFRLAPVVLIIAALLSAGYLLPVAIRAFFPGEGFGRVRRNEVKPALLVPIIILSLVAFLGGIRLPSLRFESFGAVYSCVALLLWIVTAMFSREYFRGAAGQRRYWFFCLITLAATLGVFGSFDLLTLFVFFEIMSLASYPLVINDETKAAMRAGQSYLALSIFGGMSMLLGLLVLQNRLGTLDFEAMRAAASTLADKSHLYLPAVLLMFGFAAKAGLFPLHFWLPKAHPAAPVPASALLSGVLIKTGVFGALIIAVFLLPGDINWGMAILVLAAITMLSGAVLGVFSVDMKRTLACSSVSQIGFMLTGAALVSILGDHNALAVRGTLLHMVNHSIFKLILFLLAGIVYKNTHKLNYNDIRGFGRGKLLFAPAFVLAALGLCGAPFFSGYVSKTLLHESIVEAAQLYSGTAGAGLLRAVEYVFLLTGGLTVAYMLKLFTVLFVQKPIHAQAKKYASLLSIVPVFIVSFFIPAGGIFPQIMESLAALMEGTFHGHAPGHAVPYFEWLALQGAVISAAVGIVIFAALRIHAHRRGGWLDPVPARLDIENSLARPAVRLLCRVFLRTSEQRPLSRFYAKFYSLVADDPNAEEPDQELFAGTLSNTLLFFAIGVTAVLLYVFVYAAI